MASDKADANSYGVTNLATGTTTGDGTAVDVTLGFTPRYVRVWDDTGVILWEKFAGMPDANSIKQVTAGTTTKDTTSAIVIKGSKAADTYKGFQLSAALAGNGKSLFWAAFGG